VETHRIKGVLELRMLNSLVLSQKKRFHHLGTACIVELLCSHSPTHLITPIICGMPNRRCRTVVLHRRFPFDNRTDSLSPPKKKDSVLRICMHKSSNIVPRRKWYSGKTGDGWSNAVSAPSCKKWTRIHNEVITAPPPAKNGPDCTS